MQVKVRNDASHFTRSDIYPEIKKYFAYNDHRTSDYLKHATLKSLTRAPFSHSLFLDAHEAFSFAQLPVHSVACPCTYATIPRSFIREILGFLSPSFSQVFFLSHSLPPCLSVSLSLVQSLSGNSFDPLARVSDSFVDGSWDRVPLPGHALRIRSIFSFA